LVKGKGQENFLTEENCEAMGIYLEALVSDQPPVDVIPTIDILKIEPRLVES